MNKNRIIQDARSEVAKALNRVGSRSVDRIKSELSGPYPPASSPGQPPHTRTGELQAKMKHKVSISGYYDVYLRVYNTAPHADWLEFGTEKMAARPFLRPDRPNVEADIRSELS